MDFLGLEEKEKGKWWTVLGSKLAQVSPCLGGNAPARVCPGVFAQRPWGIKKNRNKPTHCFYVSLTITKTPWYFYFFTVLVHDGTMPNTWPELQVHGEGDPDRRQQAYKHQAQVYPSKNPHLIWKIWP
jgi:hypothetical protein